jgi:hypothetical protein
MVSQAKRVACIAVTLGLLVVGFTGTVAAQDANIISVDQPQPDGEFVVEYEISGAGSHQLEVAPPSDADVNITEHSGGGTFTNIGSNETDSRTNPDGVALFDSFSGDGTYTATVDLIDGTEGDTITVEARALDSSENTVASDTVTTQVSTNGSSGSGPSGGSQSTYALPPETVSSNGEFTLEYVVGTGGTHELEIDPNGFDVNITDYNGSTQFSNLDGNPSQTDSRTNAGIAFFGAFQGQGSYQLTVDVIGGSPGDTATVEVRAYSGNDLAESNTTELSISDQHPSGVSQSVFDAVAGQNGDAGEIERGDVVDAIDAFFSDQELAGEDLTRSDVVNIIGWFFSN